MWPLRDWSQFFRLYQTVSQVTGSYVQAVQVNDPDVIDLFCSLKVQDENWSKPPSWWRFTDVMHRLTDIADQMIASRAQGDKVRFYPRPVNPAVKERKRRLLAAQDDLIEKARQRE